MTLRSVRIDRPKQHADDHERERRVDDLERARCTGAGSGLSPLAGAPVAVPQHDEDDEARRRWRR